MSEQYCNEHDSFFVATRCPRCRIEHDRLNLLEAVASATEDFLESFKAHYHGFPGKLEWPEIHVLKQKLDATKEST